jgi:hypothetical protein
MQVNEERQLVGQVLINSVHGVRPVKLPKMIVWRGGNSIRPRVPSRVAYKAERGGNEPFWSPWTMYPRTQERRRNREVTVYLPALGGDGPRLGRKVRIYKCSQASSPQESLKCCAALRAVSAEADESSAMGNQYCRRREQIAN